MTTASIISISELFQYQFFVTALVVGICLSIAFGLLGHFVVIRREANIAHTISHCSLLWVTVALLYNLPLFPSILAGALLGAFAINFLEKTRYFSQDSINEMLGQWGLVLAILVLGLISGYKANIMSFLFGDILTVTRFDAVLAIILCIIVMISFALFHKIFFQISFNKSLALSKGQPVWVANALYMILLSSAIALSIKIIGALLISAFLIIPTNIAKVISHNYRQSIIYSLIAWVLSSVVGLFFSFIFNIPSGASIVMTLLAILLLLVLYRGLYRVLYKKRITK